MSGFLTGRTSLTTVQTGDIAADAVTAAKLPDDVIDSEHYAAGSIDTAHLADDAVTLAKMVAGTDGVIITYDASGNPVHVGPGSDGEVLTSTGAGSPPAFEAAAGGAYTSITKTTVSATTNIDFTGFDSTTYDNYEVWISNCRPASDYNILGLQTSTDGGSSYDAGTGYENRNAINKAGQSYPQTGHETTGAYISLTAESIGNLADENVQGRIQIHRPADATHTAVTYSISGTQHGGDGYLHSTFGIGERKSAADVDAIRFHWHSGDFVAKGSIQFLGIAQ